MGVLSLISLVPFLSVALAVTTPAPESDNALFPPTGLPANWTTACDFRRSKSCKIFFNYLRGDQASFVLSAEDANAASRSMPSIRFITTPRNVRGTVRYGSKYLIPSPYAPTKAICITFRYRLTGSSSLSLVEQPVGAAEHEFWKDDGSNAAMKGQWRFHTSQITQNNPVKVIFNAKVTGNISAVAITDIMVYNYTCTQRDGDSFVPYVGQSRALTDAPYWPANATIPYEIQPGFTAEQKAMIMRFINDVYAKTCVRFVARQNNEVSYMTFIKLDPGSGCSADLGNVGQTKVTIDDGCFDDGYWQIAHMIMHGLGLRHEHVRTDRDNYVEVLTDNIDPSKAAQFAKRSSGNPNVLAQPYDMNSVLHFFKDQYSIDGYSNTIQKRGNPDYELANRYGPTTIDYQKIAAIYCNGLTKMPNATPPPPTIPTTTTPRPVQSESCTETTDITGKTSGTIANTQVSGYYRPNENCGWRVIVDSKKVINMRFTMLDMEDSEGCAKDVVTIYDGDDWETSPFIANLCGQNRPLESYTTTGNKMLVVFSTDGNSQSRGFTLTYSAVDPASADAGPVADASLSPADCNFEQSTCGWALGSTTLKWTRSNSKKLPGLTYDHTTTSSSGTYLEVDASYAVQANDYAVLKSSQVQWADAYACFSFWYRFVDSTQNNAKLQLQYQMPNGTLVRLWSSDSPRNYAAYSDWTQVNVNVFDILVDYFRLVLTGTIVSPGRTGGIAVDDLIMTQDDCSTFAGNNELPPPINEQTQEPEPYYTDAPVTVAPYIDGSNGYTCDFEGNYCQWRNATLKADSNWLRYSGRSTSGSSYGVQFDHTKQTQGAKYLLLNTVANNPKTARLEASVPANSGFKCFELYYLMYGRHLGRLRIMARLSSGDELVLFEANGNKNAKWQLAQAGLDGFNQAYTLIVEGYTTGQIDGDIGIDDFMLRSNDCYSAPLQQVVPTTTPYRTPDYAYLCDFEDGNMCTRTLQMTSDPYSTRQFSTSQGGSSVQTLGGPLNDHSQQNTRGRFAAVRSGYAGDSAALLTKSIRPDEVNCMTFWYWLSGNDTGSIKVSIVDDSGSETGLFTIGATNRSTNQWINPQVTIPRTTSQFQVKFTGLSGGSRSYIAIDDVELSRSTKCTQMSRSMMPGLSLERRRRQVAYSTLLACRFANNDFCDWTSNGKWQAVSTSAQVDTSGPDDRFAHVTSGRLVVATNNARGLPSAAMTSNITGILTSQPVNVVSYRATQSCFNFYYKISGWFRDLPMDVLNVYVQAQSNPSKRRLIATLSGSFTPPTDSLDEWVREKLSVFETINYLIVFEATTGDSWVGSVAIDDIQLKTALCPTAYPQ